MGPTGIGISFVKTCLSGFGFGVSDLIRLKDHTLRAKALTFRVRVDGLVL